MRPQNNSEPVKGSEDINSLFYFYKNISYVHDLNPLSIFQKAKKELDAVSSRLISKLSQYFSICYFNDECDHQKNKEISMTPFQMKMATNKEFSWCINNLLQSVREDLNRQVYHNISGFKDIFCSYVKEHPEKQREVIYSLFPAIFAYFGDSTLQSLATELILEIIVDEEITDKNFIQDLITCFFQSCIGFHDILWNNFRDSIITNQTIDFDDEEEENNDGKQQILQIDDKEELVAIFLKSLSTAMKAGQPICKIINQYIIRNLDEAFDFFVNYIKLSFTNYSMWTHQIEFVKETLFNELDLIKNVSHRHHSQLNDCFHHDSFVDTVPNLSSIKFDDGLPVPFLIKDISLFFDMLNKKSVVEELAKFDQYNTIVSCAFYFNFDKLEIKMPANIPSTKEYQYLYKKLKMKAQDEKRDIISYFSLLKCYNQSDNKYNFIRHELAVLRSQEDKKNSKDTTNTKEEDTNAKEEDANTKEEEDTNTREEDTNTKEEEDTNTKEEDTNTKEEEDVNEAKEEDSANKDSSEEEQKVDDQEIQEKDNRKSEEKDVEKGKDDKKYIEEEADFTCYALKVLIKETEEELVYYLTAIEYGKIQKSIERYLCLVESALKVFSFSQFNHYGFLTKSSFSLSLASQFNQFHNFIMDKRKGNPLLLDTFFPLIITRLNSKPPSIPKSIKELQKQMETNNIIFKKQSNEVTLFYKEINELKGKLLYMTRINDLGDKLLILLEVIQSMKEMFSFAEEVSTSIDDNNIFRTIFGTKEIQMDVTMLVIYASYLEEMFIAFDTEKQLQSANVNETVLQDKALSQSSNSLTSRIFGNIQDFLLPYLMNEYQQFPDFYVAFSKSFKEASDSFKKK